MFREDLICERMLVGDLEEVLLDADVRRRQRHAALRDVRAWRPHEIAAVGVEVDRELDVRERVRDPVLVADLRLGHLRRAGEGLVVQQVLAPE